MLLIHPPLTEYVSLARRTENMELSLPLAKYKQPDARETLVVFSLVLSEP